MSIHARSENERAVNSLSIRAFDIAMMVIPTVAVVLRFWSRFLSRAREKRGLAFWWDDWTCLLALPICIIALSLHLYAGSLGLGRHIEFLPKANVSQILKVLWVSYYFGDIGITLPKMSVLFLYARIFTTNNRAFRYALWVGHTLNIMWWLAAVGRCAAFCSPIEKYWNPKIPGTCLEPDKLYLSSAIPSVIIDLYILLLPMPIIWGLSLKASRKVMVFGVFLCGYLVIAISLGRLITSLISGKKLNEDLTYNGVALMFWVGAEPSVSILGCSLPIVFYLARTCARDGLSSLFSTSATSNFHSTSLGSHASQPGRSWNSRRLNLEGNGIKLPNESFSSDEPATADNEYDATTLTPYSHSAHKAEEEGFPPSCEAGTPKITMRHELDVFDRKR